MLNSYEGMQKVVASKGPAPHHPKKKKTHCVQKGIRAHYIKIGIRAQYGLCLASIPFLKKDSYPNYRRMTLSSLEVCINDTLPLRFV
jgi:hypothetical protein